MDSETGKKNLAIVLGSTANMTFALANVMMGLKTYASGIKFDLIIYEMNICQNDKHLLQEIIPCKFVSYSFPSEHIHKIRHIERFTEATFSRYECFNLLSDYKKVVWLDIDILIKKDLKPFLTNYNTGMSMGYDIDSMTRDKIRFTDLRDNFLRPIPGYDLEKKTLNPGIFIICDDIENHHKITSWCYENTIDLIDSLGWLDQSILNLMVQEFDLKLNILDVRYNYNPMYEEGLSDAVILHPNGSKKFWNYCFETEWLANYHAWLKMDGSRYNGLKLNYWDRLCLKTPTILKDVYKNFRKNIQKQ